MPARTVAPPASEPAAVEDESSDAVVSPRSKGKRAPKTPTIVDTSAALEKEVAASAGRRPAASSFNLPSVELLVAEKVDPTLAIDRDKLLANAQTLTQTLAHYGVQGKVEDILPGPTVTTYEVSPAAGTKVSKVAGLADDLALALARKVRIVAPIPGKNRIGFELPNDRRVKVVLRDLIEDRRFQTLDVPLPIVLGRDILGNPVYADLASMPHVIVAGATGAGKSVGPQRDAPLASLSAVARGAATAHDRPEGRRARALRSHSAHAFAGRHRHEAGGQRAQMGGRRDGAALSAVRRRGYEEHRHVQRVGRSRLPRRGQESQRDVSSSGRTTTACPTRCAPSRGSDEGVTARCPRSSRGSSSSSTSSPT